MANVSCAARQRGRTRRGTPARLDSKALILGLSWLGIGIVYLLVLTRGLTKEPPEMTAIAEAE